MAEHALITAATAANARSRIQGAIDLYLQRAGELIAVLDDVDGDADFEPSLGAPEFPMVFQRMPPLPWAVGVRDDRELEFEREPSTGFLEVIDQEGLCRGRGEEEEEPSLGALDHGDQTSWGDHERDVAAPDRGMDLEHDPADEGELEEGL